MQHDIFLRFYSFYGRLITGISLAVGCALFAVMWMVDANALMRKLFNQPIAGTSEITEALMPIAVLLPLAYTQMRGAQIRVVMLVSRFPGGLRRPLELATLALGCFFFGWVAWATGAFALRSYGVSETVWGVVRFPIWPTKACISVGSAMLAFQFLLDFVKVAAFADQPVAAAQLGAGEVPHV